MLTITDTAAEKAKEILSSEGKSEWGLKFYTAGSSCCGPSYGIDIVEEPAAGDKTLEKNGLKVFMDENTYKSLEGMNIDYIQEGEREGFVLTGGNAPSCGPSCGSSCG
ncbi:MAG: iron-sulfur cluster assembly accessory protein [Nitrospirae bacterium]|nr:iron-sulfur cluster assembly accessory protein [Nitrospirota bacterium]